MGKPISYWQARDQLKQLLDLPLPMGRGFQRQQDRQIHKLCKIIAEAELPDRG